MSQKSVKPIRRHGAAMPGLAGALAAGAYVLGAMAFSIASAGGSVPENAISFHQTARPAEAPLSLAASAPLAEASLIETSAVVPARIEAPAAHSHSAPASLGPRIALVIDDVGLDHAAAARVIALDAPLTLAILPYAEGAAVIARRAEAAGRDVLVHVPMEPLGLADPGPHALRVDLSDADLRARIRWSMAQVPGAIGLNNHMGSRFTRDPRALRIALGAVAETAPLFLDSMTTPESRGVAVATGLGLHVLQRDVFLDHVIEADAIRRQLGEVERIARDQGYAVVIGHPHAATLDALESWIGEARAAGFEFVTVSRLSGELERDSAPALTASASILN
tara:strand:- start:11469 stop:12479 length:1011 start_codon:yes stop_codon:yes gene_type:complete